MKLYRSLIYRELMLTRKRFILMLILFLLLALLMMTPLILVFIFKPVEGEESPLEMIPLFVGIVALTGGFMAGTNKLCYILFFGLLSLAFEFVYTAAADYSNFGIILYIYMLNIYLGAVCAVMLVDIAYSYIMMFAKDKTQLKLISVLAFVGAGFVFRVFGLFPGMNKAGKPAEDDAMISEEAVNKFETILCSGKTTLCILAVFVVLCVLFFLAMWRSHERREP